MPSDFLQELESLKASWMIGGSSMGKLLDVWQESTRSDTFPELAMLALAGQAIQFGIRPIPAGELKRMPAIPKLKLPTIPAEARKEFQNVVRSAALTENQMSEVLHLLAARGYVIHPFDYFPKSYHQLPAVYAPWEAWQKADESLIQHEQDDEITAGNWQNWKPAERRTALASLRKEQPALARDLIAAMANSLPAEERARIIAILSDRLNSEDQGVLESFNGDRSAKVRQLTQQLLARIGVVQNDTAEVAEYVSFYTVTRGFIKRGANVTANQLKTEAQKNRRAELAAKISLQSFVKGLDLTEDAELINAWQYNDVKATEQLIQMVATTGSDSTVVLMATKIASNQGIQDDIRTQLYERLGDDARRQLLPKVLMADHPNLDVTLKFCRGKPGEMPWELISGMPVIIEMMNHGKEGSSQKTDNQHRLSQSLYGLGLLSDQHAANELIKLLSEHDCLISNPMVGLLKLNSHLPKGENR